MPHYPYLIIGGGMAAAAAIEGIREVDGEREGLIHLVVDLLRLLLAEVTALHEVAAQEDVGVTVGVGNRPESVAHAVFGDHPAGPARRLLQVVRRAGLHP